LALLKLAEGGDARAARSVLEPWALLDSFLDHHGDDYVASMASLLEAHAPALEADALWVLAAHQVDSPCGPTDPREVGKGLRIAAQHELLWRWLGPYSDVLGDMDPDGFFMGIAHLAAELARLRPLSPEHAETLVERYAGVCEALAVWPGTTEAVAVYDYHEGEVGTLSSWLMRLPVATHEVITFALHEQCAAVTDWSTLCQCSEFIDGIANRGLRPGDRPSFIVPETGGWILFPSVNALWIFRAGSALH